MVSSYFIEKIEKNKRVVDVCKMIYVSKVSLEKCCNSVLLRKCISSKSSRRSFILIRKDLLDFLICDDLKKSKPDIFTPCEDCLACDGEGCGYCKKN